MTHPPTTTDALAALIGRKLHLLRQIHALTARQRDLVTAERIELLLQVFRAKAALLDEARQIDRQLDPFRQQDPERRVWPSKEHRLLCRQQADECESLLVEIKSWEAQCEQALSRERDQTAAHLHKLNQGGQAHAAYFPHAAPGPSQVDLEG